jgi:hypothetical protein
VCATALFFFLHTHKSIVDDDACGFMICNGCMHVCMYVCMRTSSSVSHTPKSIRMHTREHVIFIDRLCMYMFVCAPRNFFFFGVHRNVYYV